MENKYIQEFNKLNRITVNWNDLYCRKCDKFGDCHCVQPFIQKHLKSAQFPCRYEKCNFKNTREHFLEHLKECIHRPITCPFDNLPFKDVEAFIKHIPVHEHVEQVTLNSLHIKLNLPTSRSKAILAEYKNNYFLVCVIKQSNFLSFNVSKLLDYSPSINTFTIVYQYKNMYIYLQGDMISLRDVLDEELTNTLLQKTVLLHPEAKMTIYFYDYIRAYRIKVNKCTVCQKQLLGHIKHCVNAHVCCVACATRIQACSICKIPQRLIDVNVTLKYFFESCSRPYQV